MRWNLAIAVLVGAVLAMAMAFGGQILRGPVTPPPLQNSN
jgi:hypothetical protein